LPIGKMLGWDRHYRARNANLVYYTTTY
jgi:hypothetical protein